MSIEAADRFALQDVMATYAMAVDDRKDEVYRSLFTDDIVIVGMGPNEIHGIDEWFSWWKVAIDKYARTQHMLGPMLVSLEGDIAKTRSDVQAHHYPVGQPDTTVTLWATYFTDMVKQNGTWKICRHELVVRGSRTQQG